MDADSAGEVKELLIESGYWSDRTAWRPVGDNENNRAIVGNQQEDAVSALVEKLTNSVDAVLINRVIESGLDPTGPTAPKSMRDAVALFVGDGVALGSGGRWWDHESLSREQQDALAKHIWVSATGSRQSPSITVADRGEGQTPDDFPRTFMALVGVKAADGRLASQKKDIPFVQGQYNMGSSGVYPYCSKDDGFQLLVSRRNPQLLSAGASPRDHQWAFTVVRRNRGSLTKGSVFEYLAPEGVSSPRGVLSFSAPTLPILPESPPTTVPNRVYSTEVPYGTLVKLYEYDFRATGVSTSHILRRGGLLSQVELALPQSGLPVRFVEGRDFKGKPGSFQTNLFGILHRLDRLEVVDEDDPTSVEEGEAEGEVPASRLQLEGPSVNGELQLRGTRIPWTAFVFKEDAKDKTGGGRYSLIFHINGQKHAHEGKGWFRGKTVGLSYLGQKNTILVVVDCSALDFAQREDVFKPSRDRIAKTELSRELYDLLADSLRTSPELQELQNRQHQRMTAERLTDHAPVNRVLERLLKATPMLARFFKLGSELKISKPFPDDASSGDGTGKAKFEGKRHPTFLKLRGGATSRSQGAHLGSRARIQFSTDAENGYFDRAKDPGSFEVSYLNREEPVSGSRGALRDGAFSYSVVLPEGVVIGERVELSFEIRDDTLVAPLLCEVALLVEAEVKSSSGTKGSRKTGTDSDGTSGGPRTLNSLDIRRCSKDGREGTDSWPADWSERTAVTIEDNPESGGITYFVNVDNIFLRDYQKQMQGKDPALVEARFLWSLVLLSLSLVEYYAREEEEEPASSDAESDDGVRSLAERRDEHVARTTEAAAQLILPTMDAVGAMTSELFEDEE